MVFKLGDQKDYIGNPNLPYELYRSYIEENKHKFPKSVLEVLSNEELLGGSASESPYYGDLQCMEILNYGKSNASLKLTISKQDYVEKSFRIELIYNGLFQLNIPFQSSMSVNDLKWRYEEILFFDPYPDFGIKDKMFIHNIEWVTGEVWSITAKVLDLRWVDS